VRSLNQTQVLSFRLCELCSSFVFRFTVVVNVRFLFSSTRVCAEVTRHLRKVLMLLFGRHGSIPLVNSDDDDDDDER